MKFSELIHPLPAETFAERVKAGQCFTVKGHNGKFDHLITLEEIERRLNDGCNFNVPVEVISGGARKMIVDKDIPWSSQALRKSDLKQMIEEGHSILMRNMSQINPSVAELMDTIERTINHSHADLHLYISPKDNATGYNAHRDRPQHKIYLQVIGSTMWKVFDIKAPIDHSVVAVPETDEAQVLKEVAEFTLEPGDLFYMPPGVFHKVRNRGGPRISFSIPVIIDPKMKAMDRTHIPFKAIFESA